MIRYTLTTNTQPLDNAMEFLNKIDLEIDDIGEAVIQEIKPELLDELQDMPSKRSYPNQYPVEWTSDLQRKAYFASGGFGKGIPTVRDDTLINSWEIEWENSSIITRNKNKWAKFVVGSLAKDVSRAARFQQKFHQITGWKLATIPVQEWMKVARFLFEQELKARWKGAVTGRVRGRAFTSRRRKK